MAVSVKTYDFDGDEFKGDLNKSVVDFISVSTLSSYSNLIRIRQNFILEILKTAEGL